MNAVALLLRILDQSYDKKAWHGPNLRGSIRGLSAKEAEWRAAPGRRSIADIVVHAAYWKYAVRRRLRSDKRGSFPLRGSNWFKLPSPLTEQKWKEYVELLETEHRQLREAIAEVNDSDLDRPFPGRKTTPAILIYGIASHDVYHAGQIQVLKRLQGSASEWMK